ncbi:glycosyltransferase, partial [Patescibacteria group bacterium]|nr:glycosyltransferase [Patescibacteria group bacterium]
MCQEPSAFIHSNEWIASVKGTGMKIGIRILRPLLRALDIYFTKKHDFVIANSKFTLRNAQSIYKISPENSAYSHLGVDTEIFKPHHQTKLNQFLVVNTLTKFKNTFFIIAAFNSFRKTSASGYKLYIVGAGPTLHGLKKYIERERLGGIVEFLGVGPQKVFIKTFQESKALILASQEPFGLVVAEALASGTPAIVVKGSGASEIIEDGKTGYTFEYMNQKDLLGKMHAIKNATDLETEKMRTACMERAKEFAWPKVAKEYLELLNEAAN